MREVSEIMDSMELPKQPGVYRSMMNVAAALSRVGISKGGVNKFDNYKFRGIDQVYNALAPLLAEHGLLITPRVLARQESHYQNDNGTRMTCVVLEVEYEFICADDPNGPKHVIKVFGEANDRSDKATNKALSAAYKYAVIQTFAIPVEGEPDADAESIVKAVLPEVEQAVAVMRAAIAGGDIGGVQAEIGKIKESGHRAEVWGALTKKEQAAVSAMLSNAPA